MPPLFIAVRYNNMLCARILLEKGGNFDTVKAEGETYLLVVAKKKDADMVRELIEAMADLKAADKCVRYPRIIVEAMNI